MIFSYATKQRLRRATRPLALLTFIILGIWWWSYHKRVGAIAALNDVPPPGSVTKAMVMAKTRREDVSWAHELRPEWIPYIYTAASPPEPGYPLHPPMHRGREAITYLTFIIDYYDSLPQYTAFVHADPDQWHNDILGPRTSSILKNILLPTVDKRGYVNLRCTHDPGCPLGVNPFEPTDIDIKGKDIRAYFADVYMELFDVPSSRVPRHLGNVCCGQFVVSRERIRERPRADYIRMRRWAMETSVTTSFGVGWTFEKIWHVIFGMEPVYCPEFEVCRCELLGWCGPLGENSTGVMREVDDEVRKAPKAGAGGADERRPRHRHGLDSADVLEVSEGRLPGKT